MLLNPYQRFAKNEINQKGYKLALIDVNILRKFENNIYDENWKCDVLTYFEESQIKPVMSDFIFYEFIKGLDPKSKNFVELKEKKKCVSSFLDKLNTMWICNQQEILAFEFLNLYNNIEANAYNSYKIFCSSPITIIKNIALISSPFYDSNTSPPISTFSEYFEHLLKDLNDLPICTHSKSITQSSTIGSITDIIKHYVPQKDIVKVVETIESLLKSTSTIRDKAPMYFIQKEFPHQYEKIHNYSEKINHTLDRWHLYIRPAA